MHKYSWFNNKEWRKSLKFNDSISIFNKILGINFDWKFMSGRGEVIQDFEIKKIF